MALCARAKRSAQAIGAVVRGYMMMTFPDLSKKVCPMLKRAALCSAVVLALTSAVSLCSATEPAGIPNMSVSPKAGKVELFGRQGRCTVKLSLEDKGGKRTERSIGYLIDTTPQVVIAREGLGL